MKYTLYLLIVILLSFTGANVTQSQWQPDVRLTNDPAVSNMSPNNAWCIAVNGNILHVVWQDNRDGNFEIYYKRSSDGGIAWGADTRLTNNPSVSSTPSVAVSGSVVNLVWVDDRIVPQDIYYKRSTDGGISFGADIRLTNNTSGGTTSPSIAVSGQDVHVVWVDWRNGGNQEIFYKRSTDGGINFGTDTLLTNVISLAPQNPSVAVSGQDVHVVWRDSRDGNTEIYYKHSTNGGVNFGADTRLTNNGWDSFTPSVAVSGQVVHVVWRDSRNSGNNEIYYKRSPDGGISFGVDTRLTVSAGSSGFPSVAVSGLAVHVVWQDNRDGNLEIYYKRDTTGNNVVGVTNINFEIPENYSLGQNYPNPFNPNTVIKFEIAGSTPVKIVVYDALGHVAETLVNKQLNAGLYEINFNAGSYSSGVYYYKLIAGDYNETKKMILLK